jgi:hypothetical protein
MPERRFATPDPVQLSINNGAGSVEIVATATSEATVVVEGRGGRGAQAAEETQITFSEQSSRLTVQPPEQRFGDTPPLDIRVVLPEGSTVAGNVGSADVSARGRLAGFRMNSGSGDLQIDQVDGDADIKAGSGDLRLGSVAGNLDAKTGSGDIEADRAGTVSVSSGSGDLRVGAVTGSARVKGASGDVSIGSVRQGSIEVTSASGDVSVGVAAGVSVRLALSTISGEVSSDLPVEDQAPEGGSAVDLRLNTVSGDVSVSRAARAETG